MKKLKKLIFKKDVHENIYVYIQGEGDKEKLGIAVLVHNPAYSRAGFGRYYVRTNLFGIKDFYVDKKKELVEILPKLIAKSIHLLLED